MLKNVVLPAPFGPMRPTIAFWGITKSTSLTATRPPNSLRTLSAVEERLAGRHSCLSPYSVSVGTPPSSSSRLRRPSGMSPTGRNSIISTMMIP